MAYMLKKWNGQYGGSAKFVVQDLDTGKQSMFTPGRAQDVIFTNTDLTNTPEVKGWEDFGEETVENLEDVAF